MNRRNFIKSVASLPIASQIPSLPLDGQDSVDEDEGQNGGMSAVWIREGETGIVLDDGDRQDIDEYSEWHRETVSVADQYETKYIRMMFDFQMISMQTDDTRWRSHWAHDCGLEITIKRDTEAEGDDYNMVVTHVDELFENHREYSSNSQIAIAQKCREERQEYL